MVSSALLTVVGDLSLYRSILARKSRALAAAFEFALRVKMNELSLAAEKKMVTFKQVGVCKIYFAGSQERHQLGVGFDAWRACDGGQDGERESGSEKTNAF